jgi:YVTN family beta-propeller protein
MRLSDTIQWRHGWTRLSLAVLACGAMSAVTGTQAQTKAYIANTAANAVTVIDTASGTVLATIPVGTGPTRVAITPDGARAYVSNRDSGSLSVIDTISDSVAATIPVGANPAALAVSPDGARVYVMLADGMVQVVDGLLAEVVKTIEVRGSAGGIALSPDGTRAYVASGPISVIDTGTNTVLASFVSEAGNVTAVAVAPDGTRAYFAANGNDLFGSGGAVVALDTSSLAVTGTARLGSVPGQIALTPDGGRAYVGIQFTWVNTGYGAGFLPGRSVAVIDTSAMAAVRWIDVGTLLATAAGIAVTPDRSAVYVSIPRLNSVAVIDASTSVLRQFVPVAAGPNGLAVIPNPAASLMPYVMDAVDDRPASSLPPTGVTAVANVLANDRIGGVPATLANVTLSEVSSTDAGISLDPASGEVRVAPGAAVGDHRLVYRICELASPRNCDEASVLVSVRNRYVIDAVDDSATAPAGRTALATVLANDTLGGARATSANVKLSSVSSTHAGVTLNVATGSVAVAVGTPLGTYSLVYRICELADPLNCDQASVTVTVIPTPIDAVNDSGASTRSGGVAVVNVLANDRFAGLVATLTKVTLASVSSTNPGVTLNPANGSVTVAAGTEIGIYSLVYRICERASPTNCDEATVAVTVRPYVINAVSDLARASATTPGTALTSVLANDTLGTARATPANVTLSFVSLTPASSMIRLDLADGSVDVLGRLTPGLYLLVYQICESANPTNCDRATVTLSLTSL